VERHRPAMTSRSSKVAGTAGAAWLALGARCAPASAQDTFPLHATPPVVPPDSPEFTETSPSPTEAKRSETLYAKPHFYIGPRFQFTPTVDRTVRIALTRPTLFFVGLSTGVEF
jgi:hypothetical protein